MYATVKPFAYHAPTSLHQAVALLAELGPDVAILAGGCDLLPAMRRRQHTPSAVVCLVGIPGLKHVSFDGAELRVGAMASLRSVELCADVRRLYTSLHEGIGGIASVQVRATGTLVGNLCVATPASDISTPLMTMNGKVRVVGPQGERILAVADLSVGAKRNSLLPGEIVTEMIVAKPPGNTGTAFGKLTRTAADCAKLNAAVYLEMNHGVCREVRIAIGSVAPTPVRASEAEAVLRGERVDETAIREAGRIASKHVHPIDDIRSTAEYRKDATGTLVARLLMRARERATGGVS